MPQDQMKRVAPIVELTPAQRMGKRLREARLRLNKTQGEIADERFSISYVSAVERGQIRPSLGALEQLSEILGVPLADLVSDERAAEGPEGAGSGAREGVAERWQDVVEAKLRTAQILIYQRKSREALDILRKIIAKRLAGYNALELRRLLAYCYTELEQPEEARKEALEGIALAARAGDEAMGARLRNELGSAYLLARKTHLALEQFRLAHEAVLHDIVRDPAFQLVVLCNLGATYGMLDQPSDAIGSLREAIELASELNDPQRLGDALRSLSAAAVAQGDTRQAKLYEQRAQASYEQAVNRQLTARVYIRLGRALAQASQIDEALSYLSQAQAMMERERNIRGQAEAQRSLTAVFVGQKRMAEATVAAQKALDLAQAVGDDILLAESLLAMAQAQDAQGQPEQAEASFEQAIALLEKTSARQRLGDANAAFSAFLEARGQSQRALEVLRQAWNIREGVNA